MSGILEQYGWDDKKIRAFRADLLAWYDQNKRELPWRATLNPYYIWISEIMLQQTQVATVIPYFERFVATLPTVQDLAEVDEQTLLMLWQGLGYYSRARNLKLAAQQMVERHGGKVPNTMPELLALQGIGPYTAAAIGSIAYNLVEPAIDGNLLRVTARLFEIDADIAKPSSRKVFADILYELIDPERPGDFNQALMDIGATIMTPSNTRPETSPIKAYDASYLNETSANYPVKSKKVKATKHQMVAFFVHDQKGHVLYRQHQADELLTGLWHFPMFEHEWTTDETTDDEILEPLKSYLKEQGIEGVIKIERQSCDFPVIKHLFSHRHWTIRLVPVLFEGVFDINQDGLTTNQLTSERPISTLQEKLQRLIEEY